MIEMRDTRSYTPAGDGVDPDSVPKRVLYTGATIPAIGLGTFGSDYVSGDAIAEAVLGAAEVGYRHFDCAAVYGNERQIGRSLRKIQEVWTKNEPPGHDDAALHLYLMMVAPARFRLPFAPASRSFRNFRPISPSLFRGIL